MLAWETRYRKYKSNNHQDTANIRATIRQDTANIRATIRQDTTNIRATIIKIQQI
jgi:hypothetical protein